MRFNLKKAFSVLLLAFLAQISFAQKTVTGKVTDSKDGSAVRGASVTVKGSRTGTQTDANGAFSLSVPNDATTIVVSSVGFTTQEMDVAGKTSVEVSLVVNSTSLGEVVIIGYGTTRRKDLTGAIATVTSKDFNKGQVTSPEQLINGKIAGVQISMPGGAPGAGGRIRVRGSSSLNGSNDPLVIIDGVPVDQVSGIAGANNPLALLNPNDIESFNILKDASATAIYGNRATNGVIIITTKKGRTGSFHLNFSTTNSVSTKGENVDVLTASEFRSVVGAKGNANQNALLGQATTDWQNQVFQNAFTTDNNLSLTGGIKQLPYRLSLGYLNQDGILKTGNLRRLSTSLNLNPRLLNNSLKVDLALKMTSSKYEFANEGAIGGSAFFDPTQTIKRTDNRFGGYWEWLANNNQPDGLAPKNPLGQLMLRDDNSDVDRLITNLQLDYTFPFLKDLRANLNIGYDRSKGEGTIYIPDSAAMTYTRGGVNNRYEQEKKNKLFEFYLNYVKELKSIKGRLDVIAGYGYQDFHRVSPNFADYRADKREFAPAAPFPSDAQNTLVSFYGRANLSLSGKYLFTATLRRDGSSRVNPEDRWGMFPSAAFAWNLSDESFMKGSKVFSNLKLRLGYGQTGQQEIGADYQYLPQYFLGAQTAQYQFGNSYYQVYRPQAYDRNLKWETTTTFNAGIDFGFLNGRLTGSLDAYSKKTKDLLSFVPIPAGTNFSNGIFTNVGNMDNRGVELSLNGVITKNKKLNWEAGVNVTYNKNKITKLSLVNDPNFKGVAVGGIGGGVGNTVQIHSVGYQPNSFYLLKQVYDAAGKPIEGIYEDLNGDGIINNDDYYRYKSPEPQWLVGFNTSVSYQHWTFSTVLRANIGNYMYNNMFSSNGVFQPSSSKFISNVHRNYMETGFGTYQYFSDYYVENASFLRMDNLNASYDFGKVFNKRANLTAVASVQNVFVATKYRGLDPEVPGGIDNNFYKRPRIYTIGLNLGL